MKLDEMTTMAKDDICFTAVLEILQFRVMNLTKDYGKCLEQRKKSMLAVEEKRNEFSFTNGMTPGSLSEPSFLEQSTAPQDELEYFESRAKSVEQIERQLSDLHESFTRMAMMVHEQEILIERIDAKTDESLRNLERAKSEVVKYHESVTSNRNLAVKVFMVFVFFFAFYVVFLV
mmetsp:Transcript_13020/g.24201  ORF Transcript_13020/g.24201 Transcript_13020/m.24201 type:complete len:175 (+) Transcript_13020:313-837(+)